MKKIPNTFFFNTFLIVFITFCIRGLGLINKIVLTRLLKTEGMQPYILAFPTILLLTNLSGYSLNITTSRLVSTALVNKKLSPKRLLKEGIKQSLLLSFFLGVIYLFILPFLTTNLLHDSTLFLPMLAGIPLIFVVGTSDALRGYLNGIKEIKKASISTFMEQLGRFAFSCLFVILLLPYGYLYTTLGCFLALTFGELCSIVYCLIYLKKHPVLDFATSTHTEKKEIAKLAIPTTFSRIISSVSNFFEPIFFLFLLSQQGNSIAFLQKKYTIYNTYTLSLGCLFFFVSSAISQALIPGVAKASEEHQTKTIHYYLKKSMDIAFLPGILTTCLLFFYSSETMELFFHTTKGAAELKQIILFFLPLYLHGPTVAMLHALGKAKLVMRTTIGECVFRFALFTFMVLKFGFGPMAFLYSIAVSNLVNFIVDFLLLLKVTNYHPPLLSLLSMASLFGLMFILTGILKNFQFSLIVSLFIDLFFLLILSVFTGLLQITSLKKKKESPTI